MLIEAWPTLINEIAPPKVIELPMNLQDSITKEFESCLLLFDSDITSAPPPKEEFPIRFVKEDLCIRRFLTSDMETPFYFYLLVESELLNPSYESVIET